MDDLISREEVFEALQKLRGVGGIYLWDPDEVMAAIEKVPAVEAVEVVHGDWIDGMPFVNSRWKVCSVCHQTGPEPHGGYEYCPNCGAKMDGGEDNGC